MEKNKLFLLFLFFIVHSIFAQSEYKYRTHLKIGYISKITIYKNDTVSFFTHVGASGDHFYYYKYKQVGDTLFIIPNNNAFRYKIIFIKNKRKIQVYANKDSIKYYIAYKDNLWIKLRNFFYGYTHFTRPDV